MSEMMIEFISTHLSKLQVGVRQGRSIGHDMHLWNMLCFRGIACATPSPIDVRVTKPPFN
jgi:hypothetical protein